MTKKKTTKVVRCKVNWRHGEATHWVVKDGKVTNLCAECWKARND